MLLYYKGSTSCGNSALRVRFSVLGCQASNQKEQCSQLRAAFGPGDGCLISVALCMQDITVDGSLHWQGSREAIRAMFGLQLVHCQKGDRLRFKKKGNIRHAEGWQR